MTSEADRTSVDSDPIVETIADVVARLREHTSAPDAVLTCSDLLQLVGTRSHLIAILIFSLLNLLPAPPGYNFTMALIILVLSVLLLMGREMGLGKRIGQMRLPIGIVTKLLDAMTLLARWSARISSPRLQGLAGPAVMPVFALIAIVLAVGMLAPIPFTNMLPSIGLAVMCVAVLNHDGLLLWAGVVVGIVGVIIIVVAVWFLVILAFTIGEVVHDELEHLDGD